jgi:hypothetical protein
VVVCGFYGLVIVRVVLVVFVVDKLKYEKDMENLVKVKMGCLNKGEGVGF